MSIAIPAGTQPPLILDMSASFLPYNEDSMAQFPQAFFKSLGLGTVFQALGGILAGMWSDGFQFSGEGEGAAPHQGAFIAVFDVNRFRDIDTFKREMDRYIGEARSTQPLPGTDRAELAGGMEYIWEQENREQGIPVSPNHQERLETLAGEIDVDAPFAAYESTRF